jgi:hypothetical protein
MVQNLTSLRGIWTILKVEKMRLTTMHRRSNGILQITGLKYALNEVNKLFC